MTAGGNNLQWFAQPMVDYFDQRAGRAIASEKARWENLAAVVSASADLPEEAAKIIRRIAAREPENLEILSLCQALKNSK